MATHAATTEFKSERAEILPCLGMLGNRTERVAMYSNQYFFDREYPAMFTDGVTVGHSGDVVGDRAGAVMLGQDSGTAAAAGGCRP